MEKPPRERTKIQGKSKEPTQTEMQQTEGRKSLPSITVTASSPSPAKKSAIKMEKTIAEEAEVDDENKDPQGGEEEENVEEEEEEECAEESEIGSDYESGQKVEDEADGEGEGDYHSDQLGKLPDSKAGEYTADRPISSE